MIIEIKKGGNNMEKPICLKCKDCKYFIGDKIRQSRSGNCGHVKWKGNLWGNTIPLIRCGTQACELFEKR